MTRLEETRTHMDAARTTRRRTGRRSQRRSALKVTLVRALALLALLMPALYTGPASFVSAAPSAQAADEDIIEGGQVVGHYYRQAAGDSGLGYAIRAPFYARFLELGGVSAVGYPVSVPFQASDGCLYQDFQVALLQQCAGGPIVLANTFEIMKDAAVDPILEQRGIGGAENDTGATFEQAVAQRLSWLEDSAIQDRYVGQCGAGDVNAAWQFCGLPMNHPRNAGPFVSQRFQRIAFQRWTTDGPAGIKSGDVTAALGGDLLKDTGVLTGPVVQPHALGTVPALVQVSFTTASAAPAGPVPTPAGFRDRATLSVITADVQAAASSAPDAFRAATNGQDVATGDVVRTTTSGDALLTYFEGTTTEVQPNSTVVVTQLQLANGAPQVTVQQSSGSIISRVGKLAAGAAYQVKTQAASMVVRGTILRTTVLPNGASRTECWEGTCEVTAAGQTVTLTDGQFNDTPPGGPPGPAQTNPNPKPPATPPATSQASATPSPSPTPPGPGPRTQPLNYGMQGEFFNTAKRPQAISLIKDAGFGWAKQQIVWDAYEVDPSTCPQSNTNCLYTNTNGRVHVYKKDQFTFLDQVMDDLSGNGLSVMLSVVRAPAFIASPGGAAPANPDMLRDFVQYLGTRYKGKVKAIEPWNEQNLSWEWGGARLWPNAPAAPPQGAVDFVALQKAAYQGIKAADSGIIVVLPAPTPTGLGECWLNTEARTQQFCLDAVKTAIDDRLYLDFVFQVNNGEIKGYYDVIGVHPSGYNNPPDDWVDKQSPGAGNGFKGHGSFYIKRYQQIREVQQKYGDNKPMWFTEVGWSATTTAVPGYEYGQDNTEQERGQYFGRLLEQVKNEAPYVTNLFIWNLNFRTQVGPNDEKYGFGIVDPSGNPLPAYTCVKDFVRNGEKITNPSCRP